MTVCWIPGVQLLHSVASWFSFVTVSSPSSFYEVSYSMFFNYFDIFVSLIFFSLEESFTN